MKQDVRESSVRNARRRKLLQFGAIGGGAFALAWLLKPALSLFREGAPFEKEVLFENFRVVETNEELQFYNKRSKEAIFVIEK